MMRSLLALAALYPLASIAGESASGSSDHTRGKLPLLVKSMCLTPGAVLFAHREGRGTTLDLRVLTRGQSVTPEVSAYPPTEDASPLAAAEMAVEPETASSVTSRALWAEDPDSKLLRVSIAVPPETPGGLYLASFGGNQPFTVLDATTGKVALYCPGGFWSAVRQSGLFHGRESTPYVFRVPAELSELHLILGRSLRVKAPDGSVALEISPDNVGRIAIPVKGRGGIWSIEPNFHGSGSLGVSPPSFARLLNVAPVVAFGSPEHLPEGTVHPSEKASTPSPRATRSLEFVPGIAGQAVRLTGERSLSFPKGKALTQGGYACFPGSSGTVELWFRPDWFNHEIPIPPNGFVTRAFLTGPHIRLNYLYGGRHWNRQIYSDLQVELLADRAGMGLPRLGAQEQHFFRAGLWTHVACTWHVWEVRNSPKRLPPKEMVSGSVEWPARWRVFASLNRADPVPPTEVLATYPEKLEIDGRVLTGKDIEVKGSRFDFPGTLKKEPTGRTAYVFLALESLREQKATLGMGADWWMQAWVNGKLVHDTTETSNVHFPFSIWNHPVNVQLRKGRNILAVRFIRGGGSVLALGGPDQLRSTPLPPPKGKAPPPDGKEGQFAIFVNGRLLADTRGALREPFLHGLTGWDRFSLSSEGNEVVLGPLDGTTDMLRLSDVVRYRESFVPPKVPPEPDEHTRALFLFDGNLKGASAFFQQPVEAR